MSENNGFSASSIFLAFILGGVVGAGVTLLMAPQSGRDARERIKDMTENIKEKTTDYVEQAKDKITSTVKQSKDFFENKKSLLSTAVEAGKEAYEKEKEKL